VAGGWDSLRLDDLEPIPVVDGALLWKPIRRTLGIEAFGINAYTADEGQPIVAEHTETQPLAGRHQELYYVLSGRATFTVDGEEIDAPVGTCVFLDKPEERRGARAVEDGTTVLAIGGVRGEAFKVSPWEFAFAATPAWKANRWDEVAALYHEGLELHPGNASLLYNLACAEALAGEPDAALEHLAGAATDPRFRKFAETDTDLDSLRDDPRFSEALGSQPG